MIEVTTNDDGVLHLSDEEYCSFFIERQSDIVSIRYEDQIDPNQIYVDAVDRLFQVMIDMGLAEDEPPQEVNWMRDGF